MTKIILIRHGATTWNKLGKYYGWTDIDLSEDGIMQAKCLAENFPVSKIDKIYSSDLRRAYNTAEYIGSKFHCKVQTNKNLREMNFGKWEGLVYQEVLAQWPAEVEKFIEHPNKVKIPDGETFAQVQQRVMNSINNILAVNNNKTVVVVVHGVVIAVTLAAVLGVDLQYLGNFQQSNTGVNILSYKQEKWKVELINGTAHL